VIRLLLALHPKARRRTHGEEFAVLLEKSRPTPLAVLDVLAQAAKLHTARNDLRERPPLVVTGTAEICQRAWMREVG
jgi:hypothetical protein